jgi:hypothetical protein
VFLRLGIVSIVEVVSTDESDKRDDGAKQGLSSSVFRSIASLFLNEAILGGTSWSW